MSPSPFLNTTEAAAYLMLAPSTLSRWRLENRGASPPEVRLVRSLRSLRS